MLLAGVVVLSVHSVVRATHSVNGGNAIVVSDGSGAPPIAATLTEQEQQLINAESEFNPEFDPSIDLSEFDFTNDPFTQEWETEFNEVHNQQQSNHFRFEFENGNLPINEQSVIPDTSKQDNGVQPVHPSNAAVIAPEQQLINQFELSKSETIKKDNSHADPFRFVQPVSDPVTRSTVDDPIATFFANAAEIPSISQHMHDGPPPLPAGLPKTDQEKINDFIALLNSDSLTHPNTDTDHGSMSRHRKRKRDESEDESDDGEDYISNQEDEQLHHCDMTGELWRDNLEYLFRKQSSQVSGKEEKLLPKYWKFVARMLDAEEPLNSFNKHTLQFSRSQLSQQLGFNNYKDLYTHDFPTQWDKETCRLHLGLPHTKKWIDFFGRDWSDDQAKIEPGRPKIAVYTQDHFETGKDVRDAIYNIFKQPCSTKTKSRREKYWNIIRRMLEKGWTKFTPQILNMDYQTFLDKLEITTFLKLHKEMKESGKKTGIPPFIVGSNRWYDFLGITQYAQ